MDITWKIVSKDDTNRTMVVQYNNDAEALLNIAQPPRGHDLGEWIGSHFPQNRVATDDDFEPVVVGAEGQSSTDRISQAPNVVGSWNEEYLRAMIYQIMEEMRESTV